MIFSSGKSIVIICACTAILNACNHQTELEGKWIGSEIRKPCIEWTLTIQGNQFHLIREDFRNWYRGRFKINGNCVLKKIDLLIQDTHARSQNGKTIMGIFEINCDALTVVVGPPGKSPRPLSLDEHGGVVVFDFIKG